MPSKLLACEFAKGCKCSNDFASYSDPCNAAVDFPARGAPRALAAQPQLSGENSHTNKCSVEEQIIKFRVVIVKAI